MATIKSLTNLEQSKRLAEILPPESADYFHAPDAGIVVTEPYKLIEDDETVITAYKGAIPCWSQAALYDRLPVVIGNVLEKNALRLRMDKGENDFNVWYDNLDTGSVEEGLDVVGSNPDDAYYKMIVKLHEQKLL